jgi:ferredoxin-nitrite reductase
MVSTAAVSNASCGILRSLCGQNRPRPRHSYRGVVTAAAAEDTLSLDDLKAQQNINMEVSGLKHLPEETQYRILSNKKSNKFEKIKAQKCGSNLWTEVEELAVLLRNGDVKWEDLDLDDVDIRYVV